jgi:ABC-2 type transport system ATP-binding protein
VLAVEDVRRSFGEVTALAGVSLEIGRGEIVGLLGPNGAGKTTLVSIIAGLLRPDSGTVRVQGLDVQTNSLAVRGMLGLAAQELAVYVQQSVERNLRFFGTLVGLSGARLRERIDVAAEALELTDLLQRPARTLSGGQKRRVHTAIALLGEPPLLLLDEPTAGVDVHSRTAMLEMIRRLVDDGVAICYATHYLQEIETLGASVAVLDSGRLIARGSIPELIAASGPGSVEIRFEGAVPEELGRLGSISDDPTVLRIAADDPGPALAEIGPCASRVRSIDVIRPSLETVYLSLTRRNAPPQDGATPT